jgi:nitroimidazol reductase NimA-like FMN-containing flavoprotein (pyridoxamine 5'-phosphate oxidase superfamily)
MSHSAPRGKILKAMPEVPGLEETEIQELLKGSVPLRIAAIDEEGDPIIYPIWFSFEGGRLYFYTNKSTRKIGNINRTKRVYFSVDAEKEPYRGAKGKGRTATVTDPEKARTIVRNIFTKYGVKFDDSYAITVLDGINTGEFVVTEITPIYYSTWDYGKT